LYILHENLDDGFVHSVEVTVEAFGGDRSIGTALVLVTLVVLVVALIAKSG
jgi:hypothetical protein